MAFQFHGEEPRFAGKAIAMSRGEAAAFAA
jgi:hypothetical protein